MDETVSTNTIGANGSAAHGVDLNQVRERLEDDATVGYLPRTPMESLWLAGNDMPQVTLRRDIEFMSMHPIVMNALDYYSSGIAGAKFWGGPNPTNPDDQQGVPISQNPQVAQFVTTLCERFWQRGVPLLQEGGYKHGWAPGEHIYKEANGLFVWSHLKAFHPADGHMLTFKYQPVGLRVKNIRDSQPVDLHFASECIPAKGAWYAHRPRYGNLYGRSQLIGAWLPWRMIGWRDGVDQVINAAVYRGGYKGPIVKHPNEDSQTAEGGTPGTKVDGRGGTRRSARDVARQMVEWAKAGAGFTMSSAKYPQSQGGGEKWELIWPDHVMDVRPLIEAARWCEERILLGIGVPPELVKAGGTGSGYSGRSIPREAFLNGQQRVADAMLQMFLEQVLRPLVLWNFGDVPFNVQCKPLLQSQATDKMGGQGAGNPGEEGQQPDNLKRSDAAKDAWAKRKQGGAPPEGAQLSHEGADVVLKLVRRVVSRIAA